MSGRAALMGLLYLENNTRVAGVSLRSRSARVGVSCDGRDCCVVALGSITECALGVETVGCCRAEADAAVGAVAVETMASVGAAARVGPVAVDTAASVGVAASVGPVAVETEGGVGAASSMEAAASMRALASTGAAAVAPEAATCA